MKTGNTLKRALSLFCAVILVCTTMIPCAMAETAFVGVGGYSTPESMESVVTSNNYKWTYSDGVFCSGNANQRLTTSVLKITVKGNGTLGFKYKVSAPGYSKSNDYTNHTQPNPDSLVFWKNNEDYLTASFGNMTEAKRFYGEVDWTSATVKITDAGENETNDIYFMYKKDGLVDGKEDCAWIKDVVFSNGTFTVTPQVNNSELGTANASPSVPIAGDEVKLTAQPKPGCKFYGWIIDGIWASSEPEYTFTIYKETVPQAVFGSASTVAQNQKTGLVYDDLAEAVNAAESGEAVMIVNDCTVSTAVTVPEGIKLYVPYSRDYDADGNADGTASDSPRLATADKTFRTLTVAPGGSIEVEGTLSVGGVIGYPNWEYYQGHTSGAHGRICNNGSITVADGGVLDCWGFIDGSGKVEAQSGAKVYEPFIVYDYMGGTNTYTLNNAKQSSFTQYTMQNISCALNIAYGSTLMGHCNLYAGTHNCFYKTDSVLIGVGGIISLKSGAVLHRTVDKSFSCGSYCSDLGKVSYSFDGGAEFNYLDIVLLGTDVTTENILFPIPYGYDYILENGIYDLDTDIVLMPGARMVVSEDAELCVNDRFVVLDGLKQKDLSGKSYPSTETLKAAGYPTNGVLIVNGIMRIADFDKNEEANPGKHEMFVGTVQTQNVGAKVIAGTGSFEENVTLGALTLYGNNTTILPLKGQLRMNGVLTKLESGKTYFANSTDAWTLSGYSANDGSGMAPVTTNQTVYGGFTDNNHVHSYDQKVASEVYLAKAATCTAKAVYYYSCTCGAKGTETFEDTSGAFGSHNFTKQVVDAEYLASAASCTEKAAYYYSCSVCGEKGTETFESGNTLPHEYVDGECVHCHAKEPSSGNFFSRLLDSIRNFFKSLFSWLPFC